MYKSNKLKYIKYQKGPLPKGNSFNATRIIFGNYALKSLQVGYLTFSQMEAVRKVIVRYFRRKVKIWPRCYPKLPRTKKPIEVRMGKGKGSVAYWVFKIQPGRILFEFQIENMSYTKVISILRIASSKLPVRTKVLMK